MNILISKVAIKPVASFLKVIHFCHLYETTNLGHIAIPATIFPSVFPWCDLSSADRVIYFYTSAYSDIYSTKRVHKYIEKYTAVSF